MMEKLKENFEAIKNLINEAEVDFVKFTEKGNNAAGVRVRKAMLELKKVAQEVRVGVQEIKNAAK